MDTLELLNQKMFLGQEFLTWLWYLSENEEPLELEPGRPVWVYLGENLTLGPAQGAEGSRVSVKGKEASLAEAREGLRQGKLVEALRLGLGLEDDEFWMTVKAAGLEVSSLKLPAISPGDEAEGLEGRLLERVFLIETALGALEGLFKLYLAKRLEDEKGGELWDFLKNWAQNG